MKKPLKYIWNPQQDFKAIKDIQSKDTIFKRLYPLNKFISFATILLLLWSATTGSIFLFSGFYMMSNNLLFSIIPIIVLVSIMELGKFYLGTYTLRFIILGWLKLGWNYALGFLIILPISCALYFGSFYMSVKGAPIITTFISDQSQTAPIINLDSIHHIYDDKLIPIYTKIEKAQETTWQGITTKHGSQLALQFQEQVNMIEQNRKSSLEEAKKTMSNHNSETIQNNSLWGEWMARFGGYGEVLTLLFLAFKEAYSKASYKEFCVTEEKKKEYPEETTETNDQQEIDLHIPLTNSSLIHFQGKEYEPSKFKDWMNKTRRRAQNSKTEKAQSNNQKKYEAMLLIWEAHSASFDQSQKNEAQL